MIFLFSFLCSANSPSLTVWIKTFHDYTCFLQLLLSCTMYNIPQRVCDTPSILTDFKSALIGWLICYSVFFLQSFILHECTHDKTSEVSCNDQQEGNMFTGLVYWLHSAYISQQCWAVISSNGSHVCPHILDVHSCTQLYIQTHTCKDLPRKTREASIYRFVSMEIKSRLRWCKLWAFQPGKQ